MASIQDLHELIHSMSKYEKSQLNIYINALAGKSKEKYINDYQCFAKQKEYNNEKLKAKLNKLSKRANLSESNTNLYNFIIVCLVNVNQKKQTKISLLKEIQNIELLNDRGLVEQANNDIIKTKQKCLVAGEESLLFLLLELEEHINSKLHKSNNSLQEQIELMDEQLKIVNSQSFQIKFRKLRKKIFQLAGEIGTPRNQVQKDRYLALSDSEVLSMDPKIVSDEMLKEYYLTKTLLIAVINPKIEKVLEIVDEGLERIKKAFDKTKNISPEFLLTRVGLEMTVTTGKTNLIDERLEAFEKLQEYIVSPRGKALYISKVHWAYLFKYLNSRKIQEGAAYITKHKGFMLGGDLQKLSPQTYINFLTCARICFLNQDYEQSLEFINLLISKKKNIRKSLLSHIYCLYLMNHSRLENTSYLPYAIRSFYRSLLLQDQIYEPEKALLYFLKKSSNPLLIKSELKVLQDKFVLLSKDSFHNSFFGNGDYLSWLETELAA